MQQDTQATTPTAVPQTRSPGRWEAVARELQQDIMLGRLKPRERLVEDDVIARTGATRHAVRRAFDALERLGLVLRHANRGISVRDYTLREIADLYEIRTCLERQAALRFTLPASAKLIADLRLLAEDHAQSSRRRAFADLFSLNNSFHEALYSGAGNTALADAIRQYTFATHLIRTRAFLNDELREQAIADHHAMVDAIAAGDREGLGKLVAEHIARPMRFYVSCTFD